MRRLSVTLPLAGLLVVGFNYGKFKVVEQTDDVSGVNVLVYTNPGTPVVVNANHEVLSRN